MTKPFLALGVMALATLGVWFGNDATAGRKADVQGDGLAKDYASELPRIPAKSPKDSMASMQLMPGFHVELVAAEPLVRSPVAIDFDESGRLFVAEFPEYNNHANPNFHQKGSIRLLEDRDGDGFYETSRIYVDQLDSPVAVTCWDGGIFVGAAPNIHYFKDTKGDGKVDVRKIVFSGFLKDKAGEAMLNSFRWGLENRFHISTSLAGGTIRPEADPKSPGLNVRGMGMLFDPRTNRMETVSGTGQHGMTLDDFGRKFVCGNSSPCDMVMYDGRYLTRNPFADGLPSTVNIVPDGAQTKLFRISPNEPWRIVRTRLRAESIVPGPKEGGKVSGIFTGATGVTVYRGDAFPPEYRGNIFVGEVSNHLVHRCRLVRDGIGFKAVRADADREFLASTDTWFRPCQFANAPDGNLYLIDVYRELIETIESIPPMILKHLHPEAGVDQGRIYRIVPDGLRRRPLPHLGKATTAELVELLDHPNGWHRDTASRLLYQRQDPHAVPRLRNLIKNARTPLGRLHAAYALDGLTSLRDDDVLVLLTDADPGLREHGLRLAEGFTSSPRVIAEMLQRQTDSDLRVRYQLAFSLGSFQGATISDTLVKLAHADGTNPWMKMAILSAARGRAGDLLNRFLSDASLRDSDTDMSFLKSLATQIGASNDNAEIASLLKSLDSLPRQQTALGTLLVKHAVAKLPPASRGKLREGTKAGAYLQELLSAAQKTAADSKAEIPDRVEALRTLALADIAVAGPIFRASLGARQPEIVQRTALQGLAGFDHADAPMMILDAWPSLSPTVRATGIETLFARPVWVELFLDALEKGRVKPADIDPARIAVWKATAPAPSRARAEKLLAATALGGRHDVVATYRKALDLKADPVQGKAIFKKNCATCHRLDGVGEQIGAELTGIRDKGKDIILLNILDPNREVLPKFLGYVAVLDSGRTISGMIAGETASRITLRRADGVSETVPRNSLEELRSTGLSFMPEGLERQISLQDMADLLGYLEAQR